MSPDVQVALAAFLAAQVILLPILGLLWYGARQERLQNKRMLWDAIRTLRVVGTSRGRHLR